MNPCIQDQEIKDIQVLVIDLKIMMVEHGKDLKEHIRRTELLEDHVTILNSELIKLKTLFMVIGWIVAGMGILAGPLLKWFLPG